MSGGHSPRRPPTRRDRILGAAALAGYAVHASFHVLRGHPEDLVWVCHLAAVAVGVGLLTGSAAFNAVGFLWLCLGDVLWLLELAGGGEFYPTSTLTHVLGLAVAVHGLIRLGMPRHSWWRAVVAFLLLQQLCRWVTPPEANVNLAFTVWAGWEDVFPSYPVYLMALVSVACAAFYGLERIARYLLGGRRVEGPPCSDLGPKPGRA